MAKRSHKVVIINFLRALHACPLKYATISASFHTLVPLATPAPAISVLHLRHLRLITWHSDTNARSQGVWLTIISAQQAHTQAQGPATYRLTFPPRQTDRAHTFAGPCGWQDLRLLRAVQRWLIPSNFPLQRWLCVRLMRENVMLFRQYHL